MGEWVSGRCSVFPSLSHSPIHSFSPRLRVTSSHSPILTSDGPLFAPVAHVPEHPLVPACC